MRSLNILALITLLSACGGMDPDDASLGHDEEALTGFISQPPAAPPPSGVTKVASHYYIKNLFVSGKRLDGETLTVQFQITCDEDVVLPASVNWKIVLDHSLFEKGTNGTKISSRVVQVERTLQLGAGAHEIAVYPDHYPSYYGDEKKEQVVVYHRVHISPNYFDPSGLHPGGWLRIDQSQFRFGSPVSYYLPSREMQALLNAPDVEFPFPPFFASYSPVTCMVAVNDLRTKDIQLTINGAAITVEMTFEEKDHEFLASCSVDGVGFSTKGDLTNMSIKATFLVGAGSSGLAAAVAGVSVNASIVMGNKPTLVPSGIWSGLGSLLSKKMRGALNTYALAGMAQAKTGDMLRDALLSMPALSNWTVKQVSVASDGGLNFDCLP